MNPIDRGDFEPEESFNPFESDEQILIDIFGELPERNKRYEN